VDEADNREARASSGITDRSPTTIGVLAEDFAGETQAAHSVRARDKLHAAGRHLENICTTRRVEHIRTFQKPRERLAIPAVADEAEPSGRRNLARNAAHAGAAAPKREIQRHGYHINA